jgi:hypothetical protein
VSKFLPEAFQYLGLWILCCFLLQAWFGWKLVGVVSSDIAICSLGSALYLFSPPMLARLQAHTSLVSHFFVLAALYFYFRPPRRTALAWALLLGATALTHPYLLAMNLCIWGASLVRNHRAHRRARPGAASAELAVVTVIVASCCWQAGYFEAGRTGVVNGFGEYGMNLLGLFDPDRWSYVLPDLTDNSNGAPVNEGFNYLGLGTIGLLIFSVVAARWDWLRGVLVRHLPLIVALGGLSALAVSNHVAFGTASVDVWIPRRLHDGLSPIRASARMFWPVFYLILLVLVWRVVVRLPRNSAIALLALALAVQIADTSRGWVDVGARFERPPSSVIPTPLKDPFWDVVATRYAAVKRLMPGSEVPDWPVFASFAARKHLATDIVYLARVGRVAEERAMRDSEAVLASGRYDENTLYVVEPRRVPQVLRTLDRANDLFAQIDGFFVVAPGWKHCAACGGGPPEYAAGSSNPSSSPYLRVDRTTHL